MEDSSKSRGVPVNRPRAVSSGEEDTRLKNPFAHIEHMLSKGKIKQAIKVLETYLAQGENDPLAHALLGEAYYAGKQYDLSRTHIETALAGPRAPLRAVNLLGLLANAKGQWAEAEQQMNVLLANRIGEPHIDTERRIFLAASFRRAIFRLNQRKYKEAAEDLTEFLTRAPEDKQARILLSHVQMLQGDFASAYQDAS